MAWQLLMFHTSQASDSDGYCICKHTVVGMYVYVILEHIPLFLGFCFWCTLHHCSIVAMPFRLWPQSWVVWTLWQHHLQFIKSSSIPSISRFQKSETLSGRGFQFIIIFFSERFWPPRNSSSIVGWFFPTPQRSLSCGWGPET